VRWKRTFGGPAVFNRPMRKNLAGLATLATLLLVALPTGAQAFSKAILGQVYRNGVNQFPIYHQLGVKIYQTDLNWNTIAPTRPHNATDPNDPAYVWPSDVQQAVIQAKRYHMQVLLQIIGAPSWSNGSHASNWAPFVPAAYGAFAAAAARRYPTVHLWMIWGEPNRRVNFMPEATVAPGKALTPAQQTAPHKYAAMLDAAYGALKGVSGSNKVIGGSTYTGGDIHTLQWIQNLRLPNGRAPRMDIYSHNPFTLKDPSFSGPPSPYGEVQFSDLHRLAGWIDRYLHRGLPIFISEWTIPTKKDLQFNFYVDPPVAAKWIRDALRISRQWSRIYGLGWVNVYDNPPLSYGGLMNIHGVRKPSFWAFAQG
jgi:hypothetical protein